MEALVSSYDRTRINLCVIVQLPITSRKVPPSLTEPGTLKTSRHCHCRYVDSSCHAKLTLLAGGPLADKIVNRSCNINEHFHVEHDDQSHPRSYMRLVRACLVHWFRPHGQRTMQTTGIELSSSDCIAAASQYPPASIAQANIAQMDNANNSTSQSSQRVHFEVYSGSSGIGTLPTPLVEQHCFPTDSKERQNAQRRIEKERAKLAGTEPVKPKKRAFAIEDACEDCGENLSSITNDVNQFAFCEWTDHLDMSHSSSHARYYAEGEFVDGLSQFMFFGCTPPANLFHHELACDAWCENIVEMSNVMTTLCNERSTVLLELSGIEASDSRLACRCYPCDVDTGQGCLDLVAPVDLTDHDQVKVLLALNSSLFPWLIVMYDTMDEYVAQVQMLLCQQQVDHNLHYLKEHAYPSMFYDHADWYDEDVAARYQVIFDRRPDEGLQESVFCTMTTTSPQLLDHFAQIGCMY